MKGYQLILGSALLVLCACSDNDGGGNDNEYVPLTLPASTSRVSAQSNSFGVKLFDATIKDQGDENVIISPLSASVVLSMIDNAAAGSTRAQMTEALGFADDIEALNAYNKSILSYLPNADKTVELYLPNSFWYTNDNVKKEFKSLLADVFSAEFKATTPFSMSADVNNWVKDKTQGKISKILEDNERGEYAFVNTLFFKGIWTTPFDAGATVKEDFHNYDGTVSQVDMMYDSRTVAYVGGENYISASLKFGNSAFSFDVFLPDEGFTTEDVAENLVKEGIPEFEYNHNLLLILPKFTLYTTTDLIPIVKSMGITEIFDNPDFTNMMPPSDHVVAILRQGNAFEIDEDGVKVVSTTVGSMDPTEPGSPKDVIYVNRPFIFMVREQSTGAILLAGRINSL